MLRKGTCANHVRDISKLLAGAHLSIAARTDDDVDAELLIEKLSAVGSAYSFKDGRTRTDEGRSTFPSPPSPLHSPINISDHAAPVGTNYSRVNPSKEINSKDRDNFWKKEEEEERSRIALEQERREVERKRREEERRQREELEHKERERRLIEREPDKPKQNGKSVPPVKSIPKVFSPPSPVRSSTVADEMREQRNREAKELIGSRVDTAKAIFAQNTASAQMSNQKAAPIKPVRNSIAHRISSLGSQHQHMPPNPPVTIAEPEITEESSQQPIESDEPAVGDVNSAAQPSDSAATEESDPFSTIKRSPYTKTSSNEITSPTNENPTPVQPTEPKATKNPNQGEPKIGKAFLSTRREQLRDSMPFQITSPRKISFTRTL